MHKPLLLGKHTGNGSSISDHFQGADEKIIFDGGTVYAPGETGGTSSIYSIENSKVREIVKGKFVVQCFDVKDKRIAYIYSSQKKPSILVFDGKYKTNKVNIWSTKMNKITISNCQEIYSEMKMLRYKPLLFQSLQVLPMNRISSMRNLLPVLHTLDLSVYYLLSG